MRACRFAAAFVPLLVVVAPLAAQKPSTAPPAAPATAQPKPAASVSAAPAVAAAEPRVQFEINGDVGVTVVNMGTWAGATVNNSSAVNYGGAGRVLFPVGKSMRLGLEAGYDYHFWWNVYVGPPSYTYEYTVTATHVAAMLRWTIAVRTTLDLGGGLHMFNNAGTKPGVLAALTYHIPLTAKMDLPVGIRADAIFTNPTIIPVVATVGLGFRP